MAEEEITDEDIPKKKDIKGLKDMFKSIKQAGFAAGPLGGVFTAMEILEPLLKPLEVVMRIVGGLFAVMAAEILPPLMEALEPLFDLLMGLQPLFAQLGEYIGQLIATFLPPLINLFINFVNALKPMIPTLMEVIGQIIQLVINVLPILIDIFLKIANVVLAVLKPILDWLNSLSPAELGAVIYVFGIGLSALYGLMHGGPYVAALYAGLWAGFMAGPLLAGYQEGGIAMGPQIATLAETEPELIAPLTPFNRRMDAMISAQEETNSYLKEILEEKIFRHTLEGF